MEEFQQNIKELNDLLEECESILDDIDGPDFDISLARLPNNWRPTPKAHLISWYTSGFT